MIVGERAKVVSEEFCTILVDDEFNVVISTAEGDREFYVRVESFNNRELILTEVDL